MTVHLLATIILDLLLGLTLLISVQIAAGWGELCGERPGGDKSGSLANYQETHPPISLK